MKKKKWFEHIDVCCIGSAEAIVEPRNINGQEGLLIQKTNAIGVVRIAFPIVIGGESGKCCELAVSIQVRKKSHDTEAYLFAERPGVAPDYGLNHTRILAEEVFLPQGYHRAIHRTYLRYEQTPIRQMLRIVPMESLNTGFCITGGQCELFLHDLNLNSDPKSAGWIGRENEAVADRQQYTPQGLTELLQNREDVRLTVEQSNGISSLVDQNGMCTRIIHNNWDREPRYGGFAEVGYHIHRVVSGIPFPFSRWEPEYDQRIDRAVFEMLSQDPNGIAMLAVSCNSSQLWNLEHPDDIWTAEDGEKWCYIANAPHPHSKRPFGTPGASYTASYGSPAYLQEVQRCAKILAERLSASPVSRVIGGFAISGGSDGQFYCNSANWGEHMDWQLDHSEGNKRGFQNWLQQKYSTEDALQLAWKQSGVSFDTAQMASESKRHTNKPFLLEGQDDQQLLDSWDYRCYAPLYLQNLLATTIRGCFRKPVFINTWMPDVANGHPCNKYMLKEMLDTTGGFDANTEVQAYRFWRDIGGCGYSIGTWGSYALRRKLLIAECDYRTFLSDTKSDALIGFSDQWLGVRDTAESFRAQLLRDAAAAATHGMGLWIYEMKGGWYEHPTLWQAVREAGALAEYAHHAGRRNVDTAIFLDEKAGRRVGYDHWYMMETPAKSWYAFGYSGINADLYLLEDLEHEEMPDYRFYVFPALHTLTHSQVKKIRSLLQRPNVVVLIQGVMALASSELSPEEALHDITGWNGTIRAAGTDGVCCPTAENTLDLKADSAFISHGELQIPAYEITEGCVDVLGRFLDGKPSHVLGAVDRGMVCLAPHGRFVTGMQPELLYKLGRMAGVSAWGNPGNVSYIGNGIAAVHRTDTQSPTVHFSQPVKIIDPVCRAVLASEVDQWTFDLDFNETGYVFYE